MGFLNNDIEPKNRDPGPADCLDNNIGAQKSGLGPGDCLDDVIGAENWELGPGVKSNDDSWIGKGDYNPMEK